MNFESTRVKLMYRRILKNFIKCNKSLSAQIIIKAHCLNVRK